MKFVIGFGALVGLALLTVLLWFSSEPTTTLVDLSGKPLVAAQNGPAGREINVEQLFSSARRKLSASRFSEAKAELLEILDREQQDGLTCVLLSRASREMRQVDEAVDYGLKAVQLVPEHAPAHLAYARALGVQLMTGFKGIGGLFEALPRIRRFKDELAMVVALDPRDTEARTMQVFAAMAPVVGNAARAIEVAEEIDGIDGLLGKKMLAYAHSHGGDRQKAIKVCQQAQLEYPAENGFPLILGGLLRDEKRFEEARQAYTTVRRLGPVNEDFHLSMIKQAAMQIEEGLELEEALELMQEFIAASPRGDWIPSQAEASYLLGAAYLGLGRTLEAKQAFEESLGHQTGYKRSKLALESLE